MATKPAHRFVPMRPEDVVFGPDFHQLLEEFLAQLNPEKANQHLRDLFSNELAFVDAPEPLDVLDDGDEGSEIHGFRR